MAETSATPAPVNAHSVKLTIVKALKPVLDVALLGHFSLEGVTMSVLLAADHVKELCVSLGKIRVQLNREDLKEALETERLMWISSLEYIIEDPENARLYALKALSSLELFNDFPIH